MDCRNSKLENAEMPKEKAMLPNQCLGRNKFGVYCQVRLPKGRHLCDNCQKRINEGGKTGVNTCHHSVKKSTNTIL
ncbi:MAG: hypothetical protein HYT36_02070 [Candidatus Staskawiczbacteria bacterium]|nr:hypothetical protein [Candidatus Staskawiczbacteria bacterium]